MPTPSNRPSLQTDLLSRYTNQRSGGAFDVKGRLKNPGVSVSHADRMPINGISERRWTVPNFDTKAILQESELLDVIDGNSSRSTYIKGFSGVRYKP